MLSLTLLISSAAAFELGDVEHFLVLFMENRAFDHIFGCATKELPGIDGVQPGMGNVAKNGTFIPVGCGKAQYVCQHGEDHSFTGGEVQIFGPHENVSWHAPYPNATMNGYAYHSVSSMEAFAPEQLPVKIGLAQEFGVFNNLYASIPGPSQPNHMFAQSATGCGATETGVLYTSCGGLLPLFPQRTIYQSLLDAGHEFGVYYNGSIFEGGIPGDIYMSGLLEHIGGRAKTFTAKDGLFERAAAGTLPSFSWVLPRNAGAHPNDDHPCHDVALGEQLLKDVYEALRAGPKWNQTALLVVYDDAGGFYDHVPTPLYAPPPNAACDRKNTGCPDKFAFDRLGARLANLLISPRVPKGSVFRDPRGPTPTSKFELSSIPATVKNLFNLSSFLTDRDAWAGSFHELLLSTPRADAPLHAPEPPKPSRAAHTRHGCGGAEEVTRRQRRHDELLDTILELWEGSHDDDAGDGDEGGEDGGDGDELQAPFLGENSFVVMESVPATFEAMRARVAAKLRKVMGRLDRGVPLPEGLRRERDEL